MSDTVGFISDLPHELVEAFRATLEEVAEADIILHVRDLASPDFEAQRQDVEKVLATMGLTQSELRLVEVWNKIDLLPADAARDALELAQGRNAIVVSAVSGQGLADLLQTLGEMVDDAPELMFNLAPTDGEALAWLNRHGRVTARETDDDILRVTARLDAQALGRFEQLRPKVVGVTP